MILPPLKQKELQWQCLIATQPGSLASFNDLIVLGLDDKQPGAGGAATKTFWLWESGIGNNTGVVSSPSPYS